jgi:hypothetical protein
MSNGAYFTYCHQPGHTKSNCFKLRNKFNRNSGTSHNDGQGHKIINSNNVALTTIFIKNNFSSDMWIINSTAINESIKIGNIGSIKAS